MRIPFKAIKKSEYFKNSVIIAGHSGLDNIITSINMVDTPYDYERFQVADAFVMLAGWAEHFSTPEKRADLLHCLKDIKIAGIGIYSYEFPDGYPDDLLHLADQLALPMITLSLEQNYIEVIKYFTEHLYIEFYNAFQPKDEIQEHLLRYFKGDKLHYLANKLGELSGNGIYIQFFEDMYNFRDIDMNLVIKNKDLWQMRTLDSSKKSVFQEFYSYQLTLSGKTLHWIGFHEATNGEITKAFWMFYNENDLDEQDWKLYYLTFKALRLEFEKRDYEFILESNQLLKQLLGSTVDKCDSKTIVQQPAYTIGAKGRVINFSIKLDDSLFDPMYRLIENQFRSRGINSNHFIMGNYEDHFILILFDATDAEISLPLAKILFSDSIQDLGLDQDTIIGIGNLVDADQLSFSNTHALNAQFWAKKASRSIVIFEEMSILRFLDSENGYQDAMILLDKYIIPLQDYDQQNNAELIATLQAYITSLWNYSETSRVMYIHCNTVKYRISQIKETLGIDWSDVQERINLEMAIMVHDFLNSEQINQQ
jgi:hypothetical protein